MSKTRNRYNTKEYDKTPPSIVKTKKYKMSEEESEFEMNHLDELTETEKHEETLRD
jgi:hypothetical protein